MPANTEFKFNCSICGQHILASSEWAGRQIECPSCQTKLTIPSPAKEGKKTTRGLPPKPPVSPAPAPKLKSSELLPKLKESQSLKPRLKESQSLQPMLNGSQSLPKPQPKPKESQKLPQAKGDQPQPRIRVVMPEKTAAPARSAPAAVPPEKTAPKPVAASGESENAEAEVLRVAALTPAIKLEMVRAIRERIQDESSWLPGKVKGENAYAAKITDGETVLVNAKDSEASRFSLLGAVLLEFHLRRVARSATGRRRFLDEEIPGAVRKVMNPGMEGEAQDEQGAAPEGPDPLTASHAQCLEALDLLENDYSEEKQRKSAEHAKRRLGKVRLPDLVSRLEKRGPITPEDVATALYHELMEVRGRLEKLERKAGGN